MALILAECALIGAVISLVVSRRKCGWSSVSISRESLWDISAPKPSVLSYHEIRRKTFSMLGSFFRA